MSKFSLNVSKITPPRQWPYRCLTDRIIFFNQVFDPVCQWPYQVSQTGFFHFFKNTFSTLNISDHTKVSQTGFKKPRSVRPWYGHWRPGVKTRSDRPWYGHRGLLNSYGHWWVKYFFNIFCKVFQRYFTISFEIFTKFSSR